MDTYAGDNYAGPFQQATNYWPGRRYAYRTRTDKGIIGRPVTNFRANVIISMRMAKAKGTWTADWSCA